MKLDGVKILRAFVNSRGFLEIHYEDDKGRNWIGRIHGAIEKIIEELEARGIEVEWEPQIKIPF